MKVLVTLLIGAALGVGLHIKYGKDVRNFTDETTSKVSSYIPGK